MHVVDWLPTVASLAGYNSKEDLKWDGQNQWPALTSQAKNSAPRTIYIAMRKGGSLRHGDWKLIVPGQGSEQLYNIGEDPYERWTLPKSNRTSRGA